MKLYRIVDKSQDNITHWTSDYSLIEDYLNIKPHYKADATPDFSHFDIIFQLDKNDDSITTTVTKENLFDAISKYIRN